MKTAAQVFIILSMVCGFWMILPLIFGGIALSQMSKGQRPSTGISVCVLLFCSFVGGILLLCAKDEDFYKDSEWLREVKTGPFYAIKSVASTLGALGGIKANERFEPQYE